MEYRLRIVPLGLGLMASVLVFVSSCAGTAAAPTPTSNPIVAMVASASPTVAPAPIPVPSPIVTPSALVVGNTGGIGVFIRRTPGGEIIRAWQDGAEMVVVGQDSQAKGVTWKNVRDMDGNEGWVATEYLVKH